MAPIVLHFPIFTEDQLSILFQVEEIPGLCIGGDIDLSCKKVGYIIFSRKGGIDANGKSPSELVTAWYYKNIVHKFVADIRENDHIAKWKRGSHVDLDFRAVTKLDSDKSMMKILKRDDVYEADKRNGNIVFKIAAAATGCYQPLDLAKLFSLLNQEVRKVDGSQELLYQFFRERLNSLKQRGIVMCQNQNTIKQMAGIVAGCPLAYQKVFTRKRIR